MCKEEIGKAIESIADQFGYTEQSQQLVEEMAELTVAIHKLHRACKPCTNREAEERYQIALDNVKEEIADVGVMLEQIVYLLQIPKEELLALMEFKVNRTKEKISRIKAGK